MAEVYSLLQQIISRTSKSPTIVNENSKFVVSTYWWGRGNLNQNTARPCIFFYETMIKTCITKVVKYVDYVVKHQSSALDTSIQDKTLGLIFKMLNNQQYNNADYQRFIDKKTKDYLGMIYEHCKLDPKDSDLDNKSMRILENSKALGKTPTTFEYKNAEYVKKIIFEILNQVIIICWKEIVSLYKLSIKMANLKEQYIQNKTANFAEKLPASDVTQFKDTLASYNLEKTNIFTTITQKLKTKQTVNAKISPELEKFPEMSIYDILNTEFRYLNPIKFEEMIQNWEQECSKFKCNYLSIEYPEFAKPGGYQMAINAKPLFINKALELCQTRGVLYIDGDMFIRKYPTIFDMDDVDFMARGWWMDPRASEQMTESVMYDPYTFETSGGTMFFTQSFESKKLITMWIAESSKPSNAGKADDRILSLIFNTKKMLFNMKIIQLPIEYLWLTLNYDDRLGGELYDYNMVEMASTIFIEHPECLTSEDTASGAGASSNRTPKFYNFLEDLVPVSEEFHEYLFFPDKESTNAFSDYLKYMGSLQYFNDGNEDLLAKQLVDPVNAENNEQPLYVIKYDDKYGNKMYFNPKNLEEGEENYAINEIVSINETRSTNMNLSQFQLTEKGTNFVEIDNVDSIEPKILISLLIRLLTDGKSVVYNPTQKANYQSRFYQKLMENKDTLYRSCEMTFVPIIQSVRRSNYFKPLIDINQVILFRPATMVIHYLKMFLSLNELSEYIGNGSYEFMSRTRVGLIFNNSGKTVAIAPEAAVTGGGGDNESIDTFITEYELGLASMYGAGRKHKYTKKIRLRRTSNKRNARKYKNNKTYSKHKKNIHITRKQPLK